MKPFRPTPYLDARDRAAGRAIYFEDLRPEGLLHARFLRSPHAHAEVVSIDIAGALRCPQVLDAITGADVPGLYGVLPVGEHETALAGAKALYLGQEVAAVVAETEEAAEVALGAIGVEYRPLPAFLTARAALAAETGWIHADRPRNIEREYRHEFGDPDAGFREADVVVEDTFRHPRVAQAATEPHGSLARFDPREGVTIWTGTQTPRHVQRGVARALGLSLEEVRVIPCAVGGGFGGKSEAFPQDIVCALLARRTGRPVRLRLSREEVFYLHRGRPESEVRICLGMRRDGRITAVDCTVLQDGGAFAGYGPATILYSGALLAAIYDLQSIRFHGTRVLTNKPVCGPMRGHGTVATRHAFECLIDRAAFELGLDPHEVRRANLLAPGTRTINDLRVTSYGYPECLEAVVKASGWRERRGRLGRGKGLGLAGSHYVSGASNPIVRTGAPHSVATLEVSSEGAVTLRTGAAEIGQGSDTTLAIIAARELGLEPGDLRVVSGDTALTPEDLGSYSSRVTFMTGNAVLEAARAMRERLDPHLASGRSPREALRALGAATGGLITRGSYTPPPGARGGRFRGAGVGPGVAYSYAAQVAEVEVDARTGEVRVVKVWAAHDCGRALNPLAVRGQVQGSVWMGLGQALHEEIRMGPGGQVLNAGLLEYKVPGALDSPPVEVILIESGDPEGPHGAKEAGEGSLAAILPAITNAIHDAVGVWITDLPITPERVLEALARHGRREPATAAESPAPDGEALHRP